MEYFKVLHIKAVEIVTRYKGSEIELLEIIQEIDETKAYLELGYTSLFEYCVKAHGLTEAVTLNFTTVSRKASQLPQLKSAIEMGELSVPKARKITSVITLENQSEWISKAKNLSSRALEKEVAKILPQELIPEKAKYIREDRVSINLGLSEEFFKKLKRIQDLESQRQSKALNLEQTLEAMIDFHLEKKDPIEKAKRNIKRPVDKPEMEVNVKTEKQDWERTQETTEARNSILKVYVTGHVDNSARKPIPAQLRHQINMRDKGKCTEPGCNQQRWIDIHHVVPVSEGGQNTLENLRTLCSAHHRMEHLNKN